MKKEVELNLNNYTKCLCPVCPVQLKSSCISKKRPGWLDVRKKVGDILEEYPANPGAYDMQMAKLEQSEMGIRHGFRKPKAEDMQELYCSKQVGKSNCHDLSMRPCQCPTCAVWKNHGLHLVYYCMHEFGKQA